MPKLIVMSPDGEPRTVELSDDSASIGRLPENTIQLDDIACSRRHCQILRIKSGFELTDMKSRNGTKVNGVQRNRHVLSDGDIIEIGAVKITYREQSGQEEEVILEDFGGESEIATEGDCYLVYTDGDKKGHKVPLSAERATFGRKDSNSVVLSDHMVSSYHCEITKEGGGYVLRDLGSTNGCVLNGENVSESTLSHGANIRLGKTRFAFVDPAVADFEQTMELEEEVESEWGMMRAQVDMGRVKRKRTWNLIVATVVFLFFGGIIAVVTMKPEVVQQITGGADEPAIVKVSGNRVPDESFEGDEAVSWAIAGEASGSASIVGGPGQTHQGQRALSVTGPEKGLGLAIARCSLTTVVTPRRAYELSAWVKPADGKTLARIGVEWSAGGDTHGRQYTLSGFAKGAGWQRLSTVITTPEEITHARAVAVISGPGTALFDDVALVESNATPRPFAELDSGPYHVRVSEDGVLTVWMAGEYQLWDGGLVVVTKDGSAAWASSSFAVAKLVSGDDGIVVTGEMVLPGGMAFPATFSIVPGETGARMSWKIENPPEEIAEVGLSFAVSRPWLSGGASYAGESGSQPLGGNTDAPGVTKVVLGGPGTRLSMGADAPVRLKMSSHAGELRMALLSPATDGERSFSAITDFADEKRKARAVLAKARAARSARRLGQAIALYRRVVNEFPYEDSVREQAQAEGDEVFTKGETRMKASELLYERAKDFHDTGDFQLAMQAAETLFREYQGHAIATASKELAQKIGTHLGRSKETMMATRAGRLMAQGEELLKNGQMRLAALFYRLVVDEYPGTKVATEAQKRLDEIAQAATKRLNEDKGQ